MNYTEKHHLPQWVEDDRILMTDFNQMCADIEAGLTEAKAAADSAGSTASQAKAAGDDLASAVEALAAAVGSGGHTCRIAYGSYTGTGTFGAANPTTLCFDFQPVLVLMACTANTYADTQWPSHLLRGVNYTRACFGSYAGTDGAKVTWGDNSVSIHSNYHAGEQNNQTNLTYLYIAFGYTA